MDHQVSDTFFSYSPPRETESETRSVLAQFFLCFDQCEYIKLAFGMHEEDLHISNDRKQNIVEAKKRTFDHVG